MLDCAAMALTFCTLSSGSTGNSLWLRSGNQELLIDCGLSAQRTVEALRELGTEPGRLGGVLCTHAHIDHVAGAAVLARRHGLKIWATEGAHGAMPSPIAPEARAMLPRGGSMRMGSLLIETIPTSHDSPGSVAIVVSDGETKIGVATDTGMATPELLAGLSGLDALLLEMNHDEEMLEAGPYPRHLKKRIRGKWGHLSNEQGAELLARALHPGLRHLTLAHLSEKNNTPGLARDAAERVLAQAGLAPALAIAQPRRVGAPVELRASPPAARAS